MDPKAGQFRPKQTNFPEKNATVPQASGNIQDTHKTVEGGKEPNVTPDD